LRNFSFCASILVKQYLGKNPPTCSELLASVLSICKEIKMDGYTSTALFNALFSRERIGEYDLQLD